MKNIQKLELADSLFPELLAEQKTKTLRWEDNEIKPGYMLYYSYDNPQWQALVWVTDVQKAPLSEFSSSYDFTPEELHQQMLRHYTDIPIDASCFLVKHLTPEQTAKQYGIPKELEGTLLIKPEDLKIIPPLEPKGPKA